MSRHYQQVERKLLCQNCHCSFAAVLLLENIPLGCRFPDWITIAQDWETSAPSHLLYSADLWQLFCEGSIRNLSADRDLFPFFLFERLIIFFYNHICALPEGSASQTTERLYLFFRNLVDFYRTGRKKNMFFG